MVSGSIFTVGGTVQANSGLYLSRSADDELFTLCQERKFAYVLTARQMGKSSLMVRTAERLNVVGIHPILVDLNQIGTTVSASEWYLGVLTLISEQLEIEINVLEWWNEHSHLGVAQRLASYFEKVVLTLFEGSISIFVDEIDSTLNLKFTDDFFAVIRYIYNARSSNPDLERISFVLIGVTNPGDLISDRNLTPFNIGKRVNLVNFTEDEIKPLGEGLGIAEKEVPLVLKLVIHWTAGHPYLTQRLLQALSEQQKERLCERDVDQVVQDNFFGAKSTEDSNLQTVRDMLTKRAPSIRAVLMAYKDVWSGYDVADDEQSIVLSHLKLSGIVRSSDSLLCVSNEIYREVFDLRWIEEHLPPAENTRDRGIIVPCHRGLLNAVLIMMAISIPLVYSASTAIAMDQHQGDHDFFLSRQFMNVMLGICILIIFSRLNEKGVRKWSYILFSVSILGLVATKFTSYGFAMGNVARWVKVGPFTFQFSELAKFALIGVMADFWSLGHKRDNRWLHGETTWGRSERELRIGPLTFVFVVYLSEPDHPTVLNRIIDFWSRSLNIWQNSTLAWIGAALITWVPFSLVFIQPHLSIALLLAIIPLLAAFFAGATKKHFIRLLSPIFVLALLTVILCKTHSIPFLAPYQQDRIAAKLSGGEDEQGGNYQQEQSGRAIERGGLFGVGLGSSLYKHGHLPAPHTDFVYAIIAEELGGVGALVIIGLYGTIVFFCFQIAHGSEAGSFESLFCAQVGSVIAIQVIGNISVVTGLLPVTGMPLPFLGYGGSALYSTAVGLGCVLGISRKGGTGLHLTYLINYLPPRLRLYAEDMQGYFASHLSFLEDEDEAASMNQEKYDAQKVNS